MENLFQLQEKSLAITSLTITRHNKFKFAFQRKREKELQIPKLYLDVNLSSLYAYC